MIPESHFHSCFKKEHLQINTSPDDNQPPLNVSFKSIFPKVKLSSKEFAVNKPSVVLNLNPMFAYPSFATAWCTEER